MTSSSILPSFLASNNYLPVLASAKSLQLENKLFEGGAARLPVATHAMKSAGTTLGRMMYQDLRAHIDYRTERTNLIVIAGRGNNTGDALYAAASFLAEFSSSSSSSSLSAYATPYVNVVHCFDSPSVWSDGVKDAMQVLNHVSKTQAQRYNSIFGAISDISESTLVTGRSPFSVHDHFLMEKNYDNNNNSDTSAEKTSCLSEDEIKEVFDSVTRPIAGEAICVLDGVFGMQFRPPLRGATKHFVKFCNEPKIDFKNSLISQDPIRVRCTVDVSSGIGDESDLENAFLSDYTYATGILKEPLVNTPVDITGRIRLVDLKFFDPKSIYTTDLHDKSFSITKFLEEQVMNDTSSGKKWVVSPLALQNSSNRAPRDCSSDKRSSGNLIIVGGSEGMPGACIMSTRAAVRSGVGLVTVCAPASVCQIGTIVCPEAMFVPIPTIPAADGEDVRAQNSFDKDVFMKTIEGLVSTGKYDALLVGPGMGRAKGTQESIVCLVENIVASSSLSSSSSSYFKKNHHFKSLIIDADALQPDVIRVLAKEQNGNGSSNVQVVMTPHGGELIRCLSGCGCENNSNTVNPGDITNQGRLLSQRTNNSIVIQKGPRSWVHFKDHSVLLPSGGPVLARGGSGDVLAGLVAGAVCFNTKQQEQKQSADPFRVFDAVIRGALKHGFAADEIAREKGEEGLATTDLLAKL